MIAIDSSALVAIVLGEPEAEPILDALMSAPSLLSSANFIEAAMVVESRQGRDATRDLDLLVDGAGTEIVACDRAHIGAAIRAWRRFGKGIHPAGLNYGDCFAYATATLRGVPLLFKGNDFTQTDLPIVDW